MNQISYFALCLSHGENTYGSLYKMIYECPKPDQNALHLMKLFLTVEEEVDNFRLAAM